MADHAKPSGNPFAYDASQVKKAVVGFVGFVVTVLSTVLAINADVIPADWLWVVHVIIALAGSYGIFRVTNTPPGQIVPDDDGRGDIRPLMARPDRDTTHGPHTSGH